MKDTGSSATSCRPCTRQTNPCETDVKQTGTERQQEQAEKKWKGEN